MKRIISIIAAAVLLAGCAANSGKTPMRCEFREDSHAAGMGIGILDDRGQEY